MNDYIEYELDDGTIIQFEGESGGGRVGLGDTARHTFGATLDNVKKVAQEVRTRLADVEAQEVEVSFGLKATGEAGSGFVFGKVGLDASYTVTLKWTKPPMST